ncbi:BTB And Kelch [Ostertagia ostertagi]
MEASTLESLVDFCYSGEITISESNVYSILPAACLLQLSEVQDIYYKDDFNQLPFNQIVELISSDELYVRSEEQVFTAVLQWVRYDLRDRKQFFSQLLKHVRLPLCSPEFLVNTVSDNVLVNEDVDCRDLVDEAKIGDASSQGTHNLQIVIWLVFQNYQLLQLSTHEPPTILSPRTRPRNVTISEIIYAGMHALADH